MAQATEAKLDNILKEIKTANKLLAQLLVANLVTVQDKAVKLLELKIRPTEVADLLGVSLGTVTKSKSRAKGKTKHSRKLFS